MFFPIVSIVVLIGLFIYYSGRKPKNFPPGPIWYPIVGSMFALYQEQARTGMLWKAFRSFAVRYRNNGVLGFKVGEDHVAVAMDWATIREMCQNEDFNGRPLNPFYDPKGIRYGVVLNDGSHWKDQRILMIRQMKEFGFARSQMIEIIDNESTHLLCHLRELANNGKPMDMLNLFGSYTLNLVWMFAANKRYDRQNKDMQRLQHFLDKLFQSADVIGCSYSYLTLIRCLIPEKSGFNFYMSSYADLNRFIDNEIENHQKLFNADVLTDLIDVHLSGKLDYDNLIAICIDLFVAGSQTTTKALDFAMLYIMRNKDVQDKLHDEIDRVVGGDRLPTFEDKKNMPFSEAVVLEAIRLFSGNAFGVPHRAMRDSFLAGYKIPKNTKLLVNISGVLLSPELWTDPNKFDPERFLCDGKVVIPDHFIPFGMGKRRCTGELMAKCSMFVFITRVFQQFEFLIPDGDNIPSDSFKSGITPTIDPYKSLIVNRKK